MFLQAIFVFSKYAWIILLKDGKDTSVIKRFQKIYKFN